MPTVVLRVAAFLATGSMLIQGVSIRGSMSEVNASNATNNSTPPVAEKKNETKAEAPKPDPAKAMKDPPKSSDYWKNAKVNHKEIPPMTVDTLGEEAMDAAEPGFEDLDCLKADGMVTIHEAATFGVKNGIPWGEVKKIFDVVDMDKDGKISKDEWKKALPVSEAVLEDFRAGFRDIDLDGNKLISQKEWMAYCNGWMVPHPTKKVCEEMFTAADTKEPKGDIDYEEFRIGGSKCKTVDDGSCSLLAISSKTSHGFLSLLHRESVQRVNAAQLFRSLKQHHLRRY